MNQVSVSGTSAPLHAPDSIQIPVCVTAGIAANGRRRPHPSLVDCQHTPWPGHWPPGDGWYDVPATWRQVLDSAITVGRDPTPFLLQHPELAENDLLARVATLSAYLHNDVSSAPAKLRGSPVYAYAAERSAQGAMAYRLGMTMTEWVARYLVGLPATTHHEDGEPFGAGPYWYRPGRRPDLWSEDARRSPSVWSFEAKAARRLGQPNMRDGAGQLAALTREVLQVPHSRVLVGTSIDDRLFTLVEHETHNPAGFSGQAGGGSLFNLARSRLIVYLFLESSRYDLLSTVAVSRGQDGTRFSDDDASTRELRNELRIRQPEGNNPLPLDLVARATEFITRPIPGTGMRLGMSPGLFAACRQLLSSIRKTMEEATLERSEWARFAHPDRPRSPDMSDEEELEGLVEFKETVGRRMRGQRMSLMREYARGAEQGPRVMDSPRREREVGTNRMEMYTSDVYLALDTNSVLARPIRRA